MSSNGPATRSRLTGGKGTTDKLNKENQSTVACQDLNRQALLEQWKMVKQLKGAESEAKANAKSSDRRTSKERKDVVKALSHRPEGRRLSSNEVPASKAARKQQDAADTRTAAHRATPVAALNRRDFNRTVKIEHPPVKPGESIVTSISSPSPAVDSDATAPTLASAALDSPANSSTDVDMKVAADAAAATGDLLASSAAAGDDRGKKRSAPPTADQAAKRQSLSPPRTDRDQQTITRLDSENGELKQKLQKQDEEIQNLRLALELQQATPAPQSPSTPRAQADRTPSRVSSEIASSPPAFSKTSRNLLASPVGASGAAAASARRDTPTFSRTVSAAAQAAPRSTANKSRRKGDDAYVQTKLKGLEVTVKQSKMHIRTLKMFLGKTLEMNKQHEATLKQRQQRVEQLETQMVQLLLSSMDKSTASEDTVAKAHEMIDRESTIARLTQQSSRAQEEINALRFSNELLIQQMAEMRGKFIKQIQDLNQNEKALKKEARNDADAWQKLMTEQVSEMQGQMLGHIKSSAEKIEAMEIALRQEQEDNARLRQALASGGTAELALADTAAEQQLQMPAGAEQHTATPSPEAVRSVRSRRPSPPNDLD
eukprot:TRINITY_DN30731_c0_g1_i1.p1 TRINITY_DN30731_c0_g1~~TRINITY_DN30731_c0_g1_i1.p1  ORF type:complete len:601 (-),score=158.45 TRINITY_DN30731_c0_g1_i1:35-1837(-)